MTDNTEQCGCSPERMLMGNPACDEKHPDARFICTKEEGHDGLHSACSPIDHPIVAWSTDTDQ